MTKTSVKFLFGDVEFSGVDIRSATVVEEFNPLSIVIPIGILDLTLYSADPSFSIINPTGKYEKLFMRQPMAVYETVDGVDEYIGQYFLDEWDSEAESIKTFSCIDIMGLLDKYDYMGGLWLTDTPAATIIAGIMNDAGVDYELDPTLASIDLVGWLPISSYREALQQVLFALGAYALINRQERVVIGQMAQVTSTSLGLRPGVGATGQSRHWQFKWRTRQEFVYASRNVITQGIRCGVPNVGQSRNWTKRFRVSQWGGVRPTIDIPASEQSNRNLYLRPQVTGVEVTAHHIVEGDGIIELYNGALPAGDHEIRFSQPARGLVVSGATIATTHPNYAVLSVATAGIVVLTGLAYVDVQKVYTKYLEHAQVDNVLGITNATMVDSNNAQDVCDRLFNYYQQRYVQTVKFFSPHARIGDVVNIETLYGNNLLGVIEKATTNLAGGNIADVEVAGIIN